MNIKINHRTKVVWLLAIILMLFSVAFSFGISKIELNAQTKTYNLQDRKTYSLEEAQLMSYYCTKDDNIMFSTNQGSTGFCWNFAGTNAIQTSLMFATNEVYDLSESWVGLAHTKKSFSYTFADGGNASGYSNTVKNYGIMLESDCPFEIAYQVEGSRDNISEYFDYYKQFKMDTLSSTVQNALTIKPSNSRRYGTWEQDKIRIKQFLLNNGAMGVSYCSDKYVYNGDKLKIVSNDSNAGTNHQITIIGWDDSIANPNGRTAGAWICQNSWGNNEYNGLVYLPYEDPTVGEIFGYEINYSNIESFSKLTKTSSSIKNDYNNFANSKQSANPNSVVHSNVFYINEPMEIEYSFVNDINENLLHIKTLYANEEVNDFTVNKQDNLVSLSCGSLPKEGTYKIEMWYDKNGNLEQDSSDEIIQKQIFVLSGVSFTQIYTGIEYYWNEENSYVSLQYGGIYRPTHTQDYNLTDIWMIHPMNGSSYGMIFDINSYSTIKSVRCEGVVSSSSYYGNSSTDMYRNESISIFLSSSKLQKNQWATGTVEFTTYNNYVKTITIHVIGYDGVKNPSINEFVDINSEYVSLNCLMDINLSQQVPKFANINQPIELSDASDMQLKIFNSWYYNIDLTDKVTVLNKQFVVDNSKITTSNSRRNYFKTGKTFNYVMLYAKYSLRELSLTTTALNLQVEYNSELSDVDVINLIDSGSGDYTISIVGNLPNGLTFNNNIISGLVYANCKTYTFQIVIKDNIYTGTKIVDVALVVNQLPLEYNLEDYQSEVFKPLKQITPTLISGTIRQGDDVGLRVTTNAIYNVVGDYTISISLTNSNYKLVGKTTSNYKVVKKAIVAQINGYSASYDGLYHQINVQVENLLQGEFTVQLSLDGVNYNTQNSFKNATDGNVNVWVKISAPNCETLEKQVVVNIAKVSLNAQINSDTMEYNFAVQLPQVQIDGSVNNEQISFQTSGEAMEVGPHTLTIGLTGESAINYQLSQSSFNFTITKIVPKVRPKQIDQKTIAQSRQVSDIVLESVDGFNFEWVNPDQKLEFGKNIVKYNIIPPNLDIYEMLEQELEIEVPALKLQISSTTILIIGLVCAFVCAVAIVAILASKKRKGNVVEISFVTNSTLPVKSIKGAFKKVNSLPVPFKPGSEFDGWYEDKQLTKPYVNNGEAKNLTLYAKWTKLDNKTISRPDFSRLKK